MIDGFIVIILAMLGCIGLGVLLGWSFWGSEAKYYKNLAESYRKELASPEVTEAILEKRVKDVVNGWKSMEDNSKEIEEGATRNCIDEFEYFDRLQKFYQDNCKQCGSQRCTGVYDKDWREGCKLYKKEFCK